MDNLNISKEIVQINKNQATHSTQIEPLVFLEESKQVVRTVCYRRHYSTQTSRVFNGQGSCQCLHPECEDGTRTKLNLMVTHKAPYMEEAETKCVLCTRGEIFEIEDIFLEKSENPHECQNGWEYLSMTDQGKALLEHLVPIFSAREAINSHNPGGTELINRSPGKYLSGCSIHLERFACNLSISWPEGEISFEAEKEIILFIKTIIHGEIPWFSSSPELILMLSKVKRVKIRASLRKKLVKLVSKPIEDKIDSILLKLMSKSDSNSEKIEKEGIFPLFLSNSGLIELSKTLLSSSNCLKIESFADKFTFTALKEVAEQGWTGIPVDLQKEVTNLLSTALNSRPNMLTVLSEFHSNQEIFNNLSNSELNAVIPNESQLIEETDKIHFWTKQLIYSDTSQNEALTQIGECVSSIKNLLGLSQSIDYSEGTSSSLTPAQKTALLHNTPVVNTILMTSQILKEEQFKAAKLNKHIPLFEPIFSDLLSLSQELSRNCFDTALLWFCNIKTLFCYETLPEKARIQLETLLKSVTKYLFSLSKQVKYRDSLLEIQGETAIELFSYSYGKILNCGRSAKILPERQEILDSLQKGEQIFDFKTDFAFFLLNSVYPSDIKVERNDWEYYNEDLLSASREIKISLNCLIDCFILPYIDCEYFSSKKLLEQTEDSLDLRLKIANIDQINKIVEDSNLDEYAKIAIVTAFLIEKSRFRHKGVCFETFNCFQQFEKYRHEPLEILHKKTDLTVKFKIEFTKEKEAIFPVFISLAQKYLRGENNLLNKLKVYSWANSLLRSVEKESSFYKQNYLLDVYSFTLSEEIQENNQVEFKENENSTLFDRIRRFEAENRLTVKDKNEFENLIQTLDKKAFPGLDIMVEAQETRENSLTWLFPFENEVSVQKFIKSCSFLDSDTNIEAVQLRLDLLLRLVSQENALKILPSDLKTVLPCLIPSFLHFFVQFCASVNWKASKEVIDAYYSVIVKFTRFFRLLVDSNNMEMRKLLGEEEVSVNFALFISKSVYGKKEKRSVTLLELLVNCVSGYVKASNDADISHLRSDFASKPMITVFSSILDLIGEIVEGGSEEAIERAVKLAEYDSSTKFKIPELKRCFEDFCLKICGELNCSAEQRNKIYKCVENSSLVERMREIKEIDFV